MLPNRKHKCKNEKKRNFTLFFGIDRANLVLRYSVFHFSPNFRDIACWMVELNVTHLLTKAEKLKKFISRNRNETRNCHCNKQSTKNTNIQNHIFIYFMKKKVTVIFQFMKIKFSVPLNEFVEIWKKVQLS